MGGQGKHSGAVGNENIGFAPGGAVASGNQGVLTGKSKVSKVNLAVGIGSEVLSEPLAAGAAGVIGVDSEIVRFEADFLAGTRTSGWSISGAEGETFAGISFTDCLVKFV